MYIDRYKTGLQPCCFTCIDYKPTSLKARQGICSYHNRKVHMCMYCECYQEDQKKVNLILPRLDLSEL